MTSLEERIRELAYRLWEEAGRPDGRSLEFWFAAKYALENAAAAGKGAEPVAEEAGQLSSSPSAEDAPEERVAD